MLRFSGGHRLLRPVIKKGGLIHGKNHNHTTHHPHRGHAAIGIQLDDDGNVADAKVNFQSLRGFEKFVEGKPAEELPRIVNRICGICPWMHHLASNKAVDGCFGVTPPPAGQTAGADADHQPTPKTSCCTSSSWPPPIS
jgi:hypothetical protein